MFRDLWFDEYFSAYIGQIEIFYENQIYCKLGLY